MKLKSEIELNALTACYEADTFFFIEFFFRLEKLLFFFRLNEKKTIVEQDQSNVFQIVFKWEKIAAKSIYIEYTLKLLITL